MINTRLIPAQSRSKYYKNASSINTSGGNYNSNINTNQYIPPYYIDESGDLVLQNKKFYFNSEYIDDLKIITWDDAVVLSHSHNNKSYLDAVNQNLATTSTPTFQGASYTNTINMHKQNIWNTGVIQFDDDDNCDYRLQSRGRYGLNLNGNLQTQGLSTQGVLNMNNNNIWAVSNIDFQQYEKDGVVKWNTISNNYSDGLVTNCPFKVGGSFEMFGANRDLYSYNYDMNIIHYTHDWKKGSRLTLTDTSVITDNLTVTGSLNCYELVANKVRATNGMLYVTDSDTVKYIYDSGAVVEWSNNIFQLGDIVLMQNFTGSEVKTKKIKITYVSPANPKQCNYQVWKEESKSFVNWMEIDSNLVPAVDDYFVKIDSTDTTRRTGILLSPYSGGYIDFYTGSGDGINKTITTSLGDLNHLNKSNITGNGLFTSNTFLTGKYQRVPKKVKMEGRYENSVNINLFECNWVVLNKSETGSAGGATITFIDEGGVEYDGAECTVTVISDYVGATFQVSDKQTGKLVRIWGGDSNVGVNDFACPAKSVVTFTLLYCYDLYRKTYNNGFFSSGWVVTSKRVYNF